MATACNSGVGAQHCSAMQRQSGQDANELAWFVVKCIRAVLIREGLCWLVLENPSSSMLWHLPPLVPLLQLGHWDTWVVVEGLE